MLLVLWHAECIEADVLAVMNDAFILLLTQRTAELNVTRSRGSRSARLDNHVVLAANNLLTRDGENDEDFDQDARRRRSDCHGFGG